MTDKHSNPPYSRKVLRELIFGNDMRIGSRVLHVGCGKGDLTAFLADLAIDVVGIDESISDIQAASQRFPEIDFRAVSSDQIIPLAPQKFDQVIFEYNGKLVSPYWQAQLLSCLRPAGTLILVQKIDANPERQPVISSCFPGRRKEKTFNPGLLSRWLAAQYNSTIQLTSLRKPAQSIPRKEWLRMAESANAPQTALPAAA